MDKQAIEHRGNSNGAGVNNGRGDTQLDKNGGAAAVVNGDPTRLEAPHGVSEKSVVRKW